jgi:hypothetical protein
LARFVIENRSRNRPAMNPLKVYANRAHAFTPGLSKDFMAHAATIPFQEKLHGRFYRKLFASLDKQALSIPFVSGGALLPGRRFDSMYHGERFRAWVTKYRSRYPRLSLGTMRPNPSRSRFLDERLFAGTDAWLNPDACAKMGKPGANHYLTWKLLFHWKAWRWVHEGSLARALGNG